MNVPANQSYGAILDLSTWNALKDQCTVLLKSGFLPKGIDTPEKAIAVALKGAEMGLPPMAAFSGISIVNGKPVVEGQLMLSQILRLVPGAVVEFPERTATKCTVRASRPGREPKDFTWTIEDAKVAGLTQKPGPWQQYPRNMLQWRAVADMARAMFPDAIMGAVLADEAEHSVIDATPVERGKAAQELLHAPQPPQVENIDAIIDAFGKIDISLSKVEKFIGKPAEDWTAEDLITLRKWYAQERLKREEQSSAQPIQPAAVL